MKITYKIGGVSGTAIFYDNRNGEDIIKQEKKQTSLFKVLNRKGKNKATFDIDAPPSNIDALNINLSEYNQLATV